MEPIWPVPKFHFQVKWDDLIFSFSEVTGLDVQYDQIEYRTGNNPNFSTVKMPGLKKAANLTLKRGTCNDQRKFSSFLSQHSGNVSPVQSDISISLLDESGAPISVWNLSNAFLVKVQFTESEATNNEVAIETMEIAYTALSNE